MTDRIPCCGADKGRDGCDHCRAWTCVLRTGLAVNVGGEWVIVDYDSPTDIVRVITRQSGDCFWLINTIAPPEAPADLMWVYEFHGRIGVDFYIVGEFSKVYGTYPEDPWQYGALTLQFEFSNSGVELVEKRDPGAQPPGCGLGPGTCPDPLHFARPAS